MAKKRNIYFPTQLKILLLWFLLPIICFALAIKMPKWYVDLVGAKTEIQYESIAWERALLSSPDIILQDVDSLKYLGYSWKEYHKKRSELAADITNLFSDYKTRKITLFADPYELIAQPTISVWEDNGTYFYGIVRRYDDGNFYLIVNDKENHNAINLGKFKGKLNRCRNNTIDLQSTTINVVVVVTLLLCLLGLGIMLSANERSRETGMESIILGVSVFIATIFPFIFVSSWLFNGPFHIESHNYPEWIAISWLLSEIGLLGGILFKIKVENEEDESTEN